MSTTKFSKEVEEKFISTGNQKEIKKESKEIFVTFSNNDLIKNTVDDNEFLTLWRSDVLDQPDLLSLTSGLVFGFANKEDIINYIKVVSSSHRDYMEISKNLYNNFLKINNNEVNEENFQGINKLIGVAIKFKVIDESALTSFFIWRDPDIIVYCYDMYKSGEKKISATLSDDNVWRVPKYSITEDSLNEEGDILS